MAGNRLGGFGSGLTYLGGEYFLALPDRGPNAVPFNSCVDDTVTYINRFHTIHMTLAPASAGSGPLPFTVTPMIVGTTLLSSSSPLVYGSACGLNDGAPALNEEDHTNYFTGRSDGFDPFELSTSPSNARFDPESIRASNSLNKVYISDEYGPYVYEFNRENGRRTHAYTLPNKFAAKNVSAMGNTEIGGNISGRVANKGMEGLAITPNGHLLVGVMQSPLIQDGGDVKGGVTRIVTIDVGNGKMHEYAYQLDTGVKTTISDIVAINNTDFLVDERDSKGLGDDSAAGFKRIYRISLSGAFDITNLSGAANIGPKAVAKTLVLDVVDALVGIGMSPFDIPAKLEGITFGQDVQVGNATKHTLWIANDNDFSAVVTNTNGTTTSNPNRVFVFAFSDTDLAGFVPQQFKGAGVD